MDVAHAHYTTIVKENEIKMNEQRHSKHGSAFHKLRGFMKPTGWKPLTILFLFFSFQQFSGIYITLFYAVTWFQVSQTYHHRRSTPSNHQHLARILILRWLPLFQEVGSGVDPYIASILVGVTRFLCSMVNTWLLRRYKRRALCIISSFGMALCMGVSGYFTLLIKDGDRSGSWVRILNDMKVCLNLDSKNLISSPWFSAQVPVVCLLLYVCTSMVGMLTIPWTMTAELFPTEIRGIAHSISYSIANLLLFAALQSYRSLQDFLGGTYANARFSHFFMRLHSNQRSCYIKRLPADQSSSIKLIKSSRSTGSYAVQWFFAGVSIGSAMFVWILLPETHGKKLSEIEEYFQNNFLAIRAEAKAKKQKRRRRTKINEKSSVTQPLNPAKPKPVQNV